MTMFEERERAFERKFVHEEELRFRAAARRNAQLAHWTAERMGLPGPDREAYARYMVDLGAWFGDERVRQRVLHDLAQAEVAVSEHRVRRMMDDWLAAALSEDRAGAAAPDSPTRAARSSVEAGVG